MRTDNLDLFRLLRQVTPVSTYHFNKGTQKQQQMIPFLGAKIMCDALKHMDVDAFLGLVPNDADRTKLLATIVQEVHGGVPATCLEGTPLCRTLNGWTRFSEKNAQILAIACC